MPPPPPRARFAKHLIRLKNNLCFWCEHFSKPWSQLLCLLYLFLDLPLCFVIPAVQDPEPKEPARQPKSLLCQQCKWRQGWGQPKFEKLVPDARGSRAHDAGVAKVLISSRRAFVIFCAIISSHPWAVLFHILQRTQLGHLQLAPLTVVLIRLLGFRLCCLATSCVVPSIGSCVCSISLIPASCTTGKVELPPWRKLLPTGEFFFSVVVDLGAAKGPAAKKMRGLSGEPVLYSTHSVEHRVLK